MTFAILQVLLITQAWGDESASRQLTAAQSRQLEELTCRAWDQRAIASHRIETPDELTWVEIRSAQQRGEDPAEQLRVHLRCEAHDVIDGWPLTHVGFCEGKDSQWKCEGPWAEMLYQYAGEEHSALLGDTAAKDAAAVVKFLIKEAGRGTYFAKNAVASSPSISPWDKNSWYVTYEWRDDEQEGFASVAEVIGSCGKRSCRYRLKYVSTYQTFD